MKSAIWAACIAAGLCAGPTSAEDWPAFRGPSGNGLSSEKAAPATWAADKNIKWKAALPQPANGSPIVSNGRVFITCPEDPEGKRRSLYCYDRQDGKQLWARTVEFGKKLPTHATNPYGGTTPAADGERVVVWHASAGLFCYDFQGKELWSRNLGEFQHMWGYGTSPVLHDGKVILHTGPGKRIFVTALDLKTGKTVWETDEPFKGDGDRNAAGQYMGSWCTPLIAKVGGKDQVLCVQPTRIVGYDPKTGKILWWCGGVGHPKGDLAYSSPVITGDVLTYVGGFNGPSLGVRLGGSGDVTASHRLWRIEDSPQSIGSGISLDGYVYQPQAGPNRIECVDPKTGKIVWQERPGGGAFWGSIVLAAGRAYVTDQRGTTFVFRPNPGKFELLAKNELGDKSNSTPAVSDGQLFIRCYKNLYCIAEAP